MPNSLQGLRLSPQQKRVWSLRPDAVGYCAQCLVQVEGLLHREALQHALERVIARHEIFRTTFQRDPGLKAPFQVIGEPDSLSWILVDLTGQAPSEQDATLERLWQEERVRPFSLVRAPLLRAHLLALGATRHALLLTLPALCADARTMCNLVREIALAYANQLEREGAGDDPVQYAQFSEWQNELLVDADAESGKRYWRQQGLASLPPVTLPFERGKDGYAVPMLEQVTGGIDPDTMRRLVGVAEDGGTSLETVLLAAWAAYLWRLSRQSEFIIVTVCDGRKYEELQGTMGLFAKWVPLRCRVQGSDPFSALAARLAAGRQDAVEWQEYFTGDDEVRSYTMSDQIGFAFDVQTPALQTGGVRFEVDRSSVMFDRLKLWLSCLQKVSGLQVMVCSETGRVQKAWMERLVAQYVRLLESIGERPSAAISDLELLGEAERHQVVVVNNRTNRVFPDRHRLHEMFEVQAARRPEQVAVTCGDRSLTYVQLNAKANQLAHALSGTGIGPGGLVGLCLERSVEMLVGVLGILKAGAAYVPLDPHAPKARWTYQVQETRMPILIAQEPLLGHLPHYSGRLICLDREAGDLETQRDTNPPCSVDPLDLAYVIYTSGSTGTPKGVAVTHRSAVNYTDFLCHALQLEEGLHFATVSTLAADLGNTAIFASLASGGCLHVVGYDTATDGARFAASCARRPLDVLKIVPSHLSALLASAAGARILPRKYLILGGEPLPVSLARRIGEEAPVCIVINHYGPTETTVGSLTFRFDGRSEECGSSNVPIGQPIANTQAYILDEAFRPVPVGVPGELYVGGEGVARGYLHQPAQTAERFLPNPFAGDGTRLYRTGDAARYRPDGAIEFVGRLDHQIKLRGYRIEPGEIEARLLEHPEVREAVVMAREEGAAGRHLVAYLVTAKPAPDSAGLRQFLKERLPDYMIPAVFVFLEALPLTPNGKVDRRALPDPDSVQKWERQYVAPRSSTEAVMAELWAELLGVDRVGVTESFFDLGGHSLLAIQLLHRIQKSLGVSLSLTAVFEAPTVAGLAERVEQGRASSSLLVPLCASGTRPPLYCFDPTGRHLPAYRHLADSLDSNRPVYGVELRAPAITQDTLILTLAQEQTRMIRSHQPVGPYHLLGWSLGGVLALAVAHTIEQQGQSVGFLGILDTQARLQTYGAGEEPDPLTELAAYVHLERRQGVLSLSEQDRLTLLDQLAGVDQEERAKTVIRWAQARSLLPDDSPVEAFMIRYALLRSAAHFMRVGLTPRLRAPVHLWWTSETLQRYGRAPIEWECYTSGQVYSEVIDGDHMEIVKSRQVIQKIGAHLA